MAPARRGEVGSQEENCLPPLSELFPGPTPEGPGSGPQGVPYNLFPLFAVPCNLFPVTPSFLEYCTVHAVPVFPPRVSARRKRRDFACPSASGRVIV